MYGPFLNAMLGIAFFVSGTLATFLMFHLWGYPYDKKNHRSSAPESLVFVHRLLGYIYLGIYAYLMVQMVPRMWTYQIELPARTVVHLSCGMLIGAILFVKLMIVRFFKHLEGPLVPFLGTSMWLCTCLVVFLSIPFSMRESFLSTQALPNSALRAENLTRVAGELKSIGVTDQATVDRIASTTGLTTGRKVLLEKCTLCHDLRHALVKNRTASSWRSTVKRMAGLSDTLAPINEEEELQVTAYLIAITPQLVETARKRQRERRDTSRATAALQAAIKDTGPAPSAAAKPATAPKATNDPVPGTDAVDANPAVSPPPASSAPAGYSLTTVEPLFNVKCSQCHSIEDVTNYDFPDVGEVESVLTRMTRKPGFEATEQELAWLLHYMKTQFVQ